MMFLKVEFKVKETGKHEVFELYCNEEIKYSDCICLERNLNGEHVYTMCNNKIWRPRGNVLCAERVELNWLKIEYRF